MVHLHSVVYAIVIEICMYVGITTTNIARRLYISEFNSCNTVASTLIVIDSLSYYSPRPWCFSPEPGNAHPLDSSR
jgi:hypothetical protein